MGKQWEHAVRETLDALVAPQVRDELLSSALRKSGQQEVPTDPESVRQFLLGPLRDALVTGLGDELAETVTTEIEALLAPSSSEPTQRRRDSVRTPPTGPKRTQSRPSTPAAPKRSSSRPSLTAARHPGRPSKPRMPATLPSQQSPVGNPAPKSAVSVAIGQGRRPSLAYKPTLPPKEDGPLNPRRASPPPTEPRDRDAEVLCDDITPVTQPPPPPSSAAAPASSGMRASPPASSGSDYFRSAMKALGRSISSVPTSSRPILKQQGLPHVLVMTRDTNLVERLGGWLERRAQVVGVHGVFPLLKDLEATAGLRTVIVLDCKNPSVRPTALAALADELGDVQVVLWGAGERTERAVFSVSPRTRTWINVREDVPAREVAERCALLVG